MAREMASLSHAGHPAPHRWRRGRTLLLFGVFATPIVWSGHELVNYGLASYVCYPNDMPREMIIPGWGWVWPVMLVMSVLALVIGAVAAWISVRSWRATQDEQPGSHHHLLDTGEGRTRFLAMCGILTSVGFMTAIVFDTVALFVVPLCGH